MRSNIGSGPLGYERFFSPLEMQINNLILMLREERDGDRENRDKERRRQTFNAHSLHTERGEKGKKGFVLTKQDVKKTRN